jgi:hypothetical protein
VLVGHGRIVWSIPPKPHRSIGRCAIETTVGSEHDQCSAFVRPAKILDGARQIAKRSRPGPIEHEELHLAFATPVGGESNPFVYRRTARHVVGAGAVRLLRRRTVEPEAPDAALQAFVCLLAGWPDRRVYGGAASNEGKMRGKSQSVEPLQGSIQTAPGIDPQGPGVGTVAHETE